MADLTAIGALPHVARAVLGDRMGGFHDAIREPDGEAVAAVSGFLSTALASVGEALGLGPLRHLATSGATRASLVVVRADGVLAVAVYSPASRPPVARALHGSSSSSVRG
jgi:hypothetical protein